MAFSDRKNREHFGGQTEQAIADFRRANQIVPVYKNGGYVSLQSLNHTRLIFL